MRGVILRERGEQLESHNPRLAPDPGPPDSQRAEKRSEKDRQDRIDERATNGDCHGDASRVAIGAEGHLPLEPANAIPVCDAQYGLDYAVALDRLTEHDPKT